MLIRVGFDISFTPVDPVPVHVLLRLHPSRQDDLRAGGGLVVDPAPGRTPTRFVDQFGNEGDLFVSQPGPFRVTSDLVVTDSGQPDVIVPDAGQVPVERLDPDDIQFLFPSRYCEVDRLGNMAWDLFGSVPAGWARVQAVCDWVHENLTYGYEHASPTATAVDVVQAKAGVCRDFQHVAVTLCRCLNIPARYVSGWLGDIGVPPAPVPMDFHAWFEARLDGGWYAFDARHNTPRIGRVLMARGRDAADVAFTTVFGPAPLEKFAVWADEVDSPDLP